VYSFINYYAVTGDSDHVHEEGSDLFPILYDRDGTVVASTWHDEMNFPLAITATDIEQAKIDDARWRLRLMPCAWRACDATLSCLDSLTGHLVLHAETRLAEDDSASVRYRM
jgi:hypothetical protein